MDILFVVSCGTIGRKAKLARVAKGLRQIDVASQTGTQVSDVINLEKDRLPLVLPYKVHRILRAPELEDGEDDGPQD